MVTRTYRQGDPTVYWDAERCIHTGICMRALPDVFDPTSRPWVRLDAASVAEVMAAVLKCPTGALRYEWEGRPEPAPAETTMIPIPNGPLIVRGALRVLDPRSAGVVGEETRVALCRCGNSRNQPFCDNSHRRVTFEEEVRAPDRGRTDAQSPPDICSPQEFEID